MKCFFVIVVVQLFILLTGCSSVPIVDAKNNRSYEQSNMVLSSLPQKKWSHGNIDCESSSDPAVEVFRYNQFSYILRQSKCISFEAPFIYVLFGNETALVLDTGATEEELHFPIYKTIQLINKNVSEADGNSIRKLLVIHSHSHADHYAGDQQFSGKANVTLIEPNENAMKDFFSFNQRADGETKINLGGRELSVIATPGHQEEAISIYDSQTKWLLTGDTFYPGVLYIKNWKDYKKSIARLVRFSEAHNINAVLGSHIEMSNKPGKYYPIGTVYQPNEVSLDLTLEDLIALNTELNKLDAPSQIEFDKFILKPMNTIQKLMSNIARWFIQ